MLSRLFSSATVAHAHCDLYCGVYDPAQAKIEALSVVKTAQKYHESDDEAFRQRCVLVKEQRAEEAKHHLMVLWADFFAPAHFEEFPQLHDLFWKATHQAGEAKKSMDPAVGEQLVAYIDEIADIFWQTDKGRQMGVYPPKCAWGGRRVARPTLASPRRVRPLTTHQPGSISYQRCESFAEVGAAWWLLCRPSPAVRNANHWRFVALLA